MDDATSVRVRKRVAQVGGDLGDVAVAKPAALVQPRQRRPGDQLGDQQRVTVPLAELVQGDDPRVVEACGGLRLAEHACSSALGISLSATWR